MGYEEAYRSTTPRPTRYPKLSSLWNTASRDSSSSTVAVPPAPVVPAPAPAAVLLASLLCDDNLFAFVVDVPVHSSSRAVRSAVMRYAIGTSSIKSRSRHVELRRENVGST